MQTSPLVFSSSVPTLLPSIIFAIIFFLTTILHLHRYINYQRNVNLFLFLFSLFRAIGFNIRIAESLNPKSEILSLLSETIVTGSFFIVILGLYVLLIEWIQSITKSNISTKRLSWEIRLVRILTYLSPSFSVYGIIGIIRLNNDAPINYDSTDGGRAWVLASTLGFLILTFIYICCITYFAFQYGGKPIKKQLKASVLYISGALLFIELVYRTMMDIINATDSINRYVWIFYVFEMIPEVTLLIILGGVILNEWFYKDEDHVTVKTGSSTV